MSKGIYYIYKITNLVNQKIYIGYTSTTPQNRFKEHLYLAMKTKSSHTYLYNAIRKYGKDNFMVEELYQTTDRDYCLNVMEKYYIQKFKSFDRSIGYNISLGGEGASNPSPFKGMTYEEMYGIEKAQEIKEKVKLNHYNCEGSNNSFYGKHHSEETKQKIREKVTELNQDCCKNNFIIYDDANNIVYSGKGIVDFTRKNGFKYISALSRFANSGKPIHTRNKDFPYNNFYIKYIENPDKV